MHYKIYKKVLKIVYILSFTQDYILLKSFLKVRQN